MQPTLIMMVGLPGSGKTTKAHGLSRICVPDNLIGRNQKRNHWF